MNDEIIELAEVLMKDFEFAVPDHKERSVSAIIMTLEMMVAEQIKIAAAAKVAQLERDCAAVCEFCRAGSKTERHDELSFGGGWIFRHLTTQGRLEICAADLIRIAHARREQQKSHE